MAVSSESMSEAPAGHGGNVFHRLGDFVHHIKPGEWVLIAIGIVGIVAYAVWYRRQQANANPAAGGYTPSNGQNTPNYGGAVADPNSPYWGEIAQLLTEIQSGGVTTPGTSATGAAGGGGAGGGAAGGGGGAGGAAAGAAGSAAGQGTAPEGATTPTVAAAASSGSGLDQSNNNQAPVGKYNGGTSGGGIPGSTSLAPNALGLPARTGTVGIPITNAVGQSVYVPPNVAPQGVSSWQQHVQTIGSQPAPTIHPVNVVASASAVQQPVSHATAPRYTPVAPTRPPVSVRPSVSVRR